MNVVEVAQQITKIYGAVPKSAPDGFEFSGDFRTPQPGEWALTFDTKTAHQFRSYSWESPRLILRKVQPKRYVFEETGEVRPAKAGEQYERGGVVYYAERDIQYGIGHILRRTE